MHGTSFRGHPGCITAKHLSLLSILFYHTITLLCSNEIPFASNTLFTLSIHPVRGLPLTSDLVFFTKCPSSILSMWPNHRNTSCSAQTANSLQIQFSFIPPLFSLDLLCYSTHTSQTPELPYIPSLSLCCSHTLSFSPIQCCQYHYSFIKPLLGTY